MEIIKNMSTAMKNTSERVIHSMYLIGFTVHCLPGVLEQSSNVLIKPCSWCLLPDSFTWAMLTKDDQTCGLQHLENSNPTGISTLISCLYCDQCARTALQIQQCFFLLQAVSKIYFLWWEPWHQTTQPRAVPDSSATKGGDSETPENEAEGIWEQTSREVTMSS